MKHFTYSQLILFGLRLRVFSAANVIRHSSYLQQSAMEREQQIKPIFKKVLSYENHECIRDINGQYRYLQLYKNSKRLARQISNICGSGSCSTIAFFTSNDALSVLILWAIWMSGQLAISLKYDKSLEKLSIVAKEYKTKLIITSQNFETCAKQLAFENEIALLVINQNFLDLNDGNSELNLEIEEVLDNTFYKDSPALIFYEHSDSRESIILSHHDVKNITNKLVHSLNITANDRILYITPSYQEFYNEFIFKLLFPLSVGAHVNILQAFDAKNVWRTILGINISQRERINILVTEPNVYLQLIQEFDKSFAGDKKMTDYIKDYCQTNIRLMLSCFVNLDSKIFSRWLEISGHSLFETNLFLQLKNFRDKENVSISKFSNIQVCIVDANNKLLLDLNPLSKERFQLSDKVLIGRLYVAKFPDKAMSSTGELVSYYQGVLKKIGRYNLNKT